MTECGFRFRWNEDAGLKAQLFNHEVAIFALRGQCSCATVLGSGQRAALNDDESSETAEETKRRKQGWSETRIARWRQERTNGREKRYAALIARGLGTVEYADWERLLHSIFTRRIATSIGVLFHMYGGLEPFPTLHRAQFSARDISEELLLTMPADTLYAFTPESQP